MIIYMTVEESLQISLGRDPTDEEIAAEARRLADAGLIVPPEEVARQQMRRKSKGARA